MNAGFRRFSSSIWLRMLAATAIAGAIILAGCPAAQLPGQIDRSDKAAATPATPDPDAVTFSPPVLVGAHVGEPGFRVGPDGTLWVHAPGGLWKSTDNGVTFTDITHTFGPGPVVGGDADLAIGKDGSLYYTDLQALVAISVYSSHNGGISWFENPLASMVPGDDRQWIEAGPDAGPLSQGGEAVYLVFNHIPTNVFMTKSIDGGKTWLGKNVVLTTPQSQFWSMGNMLVSPRDGMIHMIYSLGNAAQPYGDGTLPVDYQLRMSASRDGGLTWKETTVVDTAGNSGQIFPALAMDTEDGLYAAWAVEEGGRDLVQIAHSEDRGLTWSAPVTLNALGTSGVMPWIDVSTPGHAVVAWYQTDEAVLSSAASGDWYLQMATTTDARNAQAAWSQTRVWNEPIKNGVICTTGITCMGGRELLDFFQVRIGKDGYPAIVFADRAHGQNTETYFTRQLTGPTL